MKAELHSGLVHCKMVLSHNPEQLKTELIRIFLRRHFSNYFPTGGKLAVKIFKRITHVDNGQGSCGGSFESVCRKLRLFQI